MLIWEETTKKQRTSRSKKRFVFFIYILPRFILLVYLLQEVDPEEKVHEIGANTFDIGASETLLRSKGAVPTSADNRYDWGGDTANQPVIVSPGTEATTTAETTAEKAAEPVSFSPGNRFSKELQAAPAVEVDEDLFGEDLGDIDAELGDLGLEEGAS